MEMVKLTRDDLHRRIFADALFAMFAEPGAMAEGGAIRIMTRDRKLYGCNYLYDNIEFKDIAALFPVLGQCRFGTFGKNTVVPDGWHYMYLGVGRHLIIEESVYPEFQEQLIDCETAFEVALCWPRIANNILQYEDD